MNSFLHFFTEGFFHIFNWYALDHILFLAVLIVVFNFKEWKKVFWLITLFTLGHLIMLLLATYNVVNVNNRLIEFLIPLTILIISIFNIFTVGKTTNNGKKYLYYFFSFFFGLIHGLSFYGKFKKLVGNNNKLVSSIEFSLGIETSQIIIAFMILLIGFVFQSIFRFSKRDWIIVISSIAIGFVLPMIVANKIW